MAHLRRTADLLGAWWAPEWLLLAGLCHAAYGTDGYDHPLLDVAARSELADLIGPGAEEIVYLYASCDRRYTYPRLAEGHGRFRDRFTGQIYHPSRERQHAFMELSFANELDIVAHSASFARQTWHQVAAIFVRCQALVSPAAWDAFGAAWPPATGVGGTAGHAR
jgi:hypothetical protein